MKIVFLCGSLEPGRDGVGDYVRRLAVELQRQGHQAAGVALNDDHVTQESTVTQPMDHGDLLVLRLPASWSATRRFHRARQWIADFDPAWLSLQFVPYAFHSKGLPVTLRWQLNRLAKGYRVHVMMHEAWVGPEPGTGLKRWLLSALQKVVISNLVKGLGPAVIHTHLPIYRTRLQRLGLAVRPLPLFSNIPVLELPPDVPHLAVFRVGVFSQADTSAPFTNFLVGLAEHIAQRNQLFEVLLVGGEPTKMQNVKIVLEQHACLRGKVHYTGFMAPTQLSVALQSCHLGLTAVPRHSVGKSGSVAAFLAHGIPVAAPCVHSESTADDIGFFSKDLRSAILVQPDTAHFQSAQSAVQAAKSTIQVSAIARLFLTDLANSLQ